MCSNNDVLHLVESADERIERLLDAERDPAEGPWREPEIPTFDNQGPTVSPWVKRAQANDLPTFDRHNGASAYVR